MSSTEGEEIMDTPFDGSAALLEQYAETIKLYYRYAMQQNQQLMESQQQQDQLEQELNLLKDEWENDIQQKENTASRLRTELKDTREKLKQYIHKDEHVKILGQLEAVSEAQLTLQRSLEASKEQVISLQQENQYIRARTERQQDVNNRTTESMKKHTEEVNIEIHELRRNFESLQKKCSSLQLTIEDKEVSIIEKDNEIKTLRHRLKTSKDIHKKEFEELRAQYEEELAMLYNAAQHNAASSSSRRNGRAHSRVPQ